MLSFTKSRLAGKNLSILFIAFLFLQVSTFAQNPQWIVYNTTNSGLLSDWVDAITIDDTDTKWIVNSVGLVEFDNINWYSYSYASAGWYPFNVGTSISIDSIGNKWIGNRSTMGSDGGLYKFDINGNWTAYYASNSGLPSDKIFDIAIDNVDSKWIATTSYTAMGGGLAKLSDTIWTVYDPTNSEIPSNKVGCIAIDESGNKWIGTAEGLAKFDDTNWEVFNTTNSQIPGNTVSCITIDDSGVIWIGITIDVYPNREIALVKIEGSNWTVYDTSNSSIPVDLITCIVTDESGNIWFGSYNGVVTFDGTTFTVYNTLNSGLPGDGINDISIDGYNNKWIGFASEGPGPRGLAVFNENGVVSVDENNTLQTTIPNDYLLYQNYPNPFNPSTKIKYSVPQSSNVVIKIFDILGNEIAILVNEEKAIGTYELTWYASSLPSGVYFYKLQAVPTGRQAGSFVVTKKMVLMK